MAFADIRQVQILYETESFYGIFFKLQFANLFFKGVKWCLLYFGEIEKEFLDYNLMYWVYQTDLWKVHQIKPALNLLGE